MGDIAEIFLFKTLEKILKERVAWGDKKELFFPPLVFGSSYLWLSLWFLLFVLVVALVCFVTFTFSFVKIIIT